MLCIITDEYCYKQIMRICFKGVHLKPAGPKVAIVEETPHIWCISWPGFDFKCIPSLIEILLGLKRL